MVSKAQLAESGYLEPLDEKTPTSVYMPRFDSVIQRGPTAKNAVPARRAEPAKDTIDARRGASIGEPSVIIASDIMVDCGCDGVADTVAIVRRRSWNALGLALIAGLSGLLAVSLGILLAAFDPCRCNMPCNEDPRSSGQAASVTRVQYRPNSAHP